MEGINNILMIVI